MDKVEIRRHAVIAEPGTVEGYTDEVAKWVKWNEQQAIPWCTTHDMKVTIGHQYRKWIWDGCIEAVNEWRDDTDTCVVSDGGPGHKWWMDV